MRFPQELFDSVIDNLSNNSMTLRACSLVDRKWCLQSQSHLFSSFKLYSDPRCYDQLQFLIANPRFIGYVKRLTIGLVVHGGILLLEEVPQVIFPHVTTLELVAYWGGMDDTIKEYILQYLPPLTSLSLGTSVGFGSFSPLASILQECPQLKHLNLRCDVEEKEDESVSGWRGKCTLDLEELEITLGSEFGPDFLAEDFAEWVGKNVGGQVRVKSLTIHWSQFPENRKGDLVVVQGLLDALSTSLEELQVVYDGGYDDPQNDSEGGISLARCTRMRTLAVDLINRISPSTDFSWILQMVSSTSLHKLRIKVPDLTTDNIEYIPWTQIHSAIVEGSEMQGKALSDFVLNLPAAHDPHLSLEVMTEIVESNMPRLKGEIEYRYY